MSNEIGVRVRYAEAFWRAHREAWHRQSDGLVGPGPLNADLVTGRAGETQGQSGASPPLCDLTPA